jgi:DNA-directed RNA polymerase subunit RPC12/RpoP
LEKGVRGFHKTQKGNGEGERMSTGEYVELKCDTCGKVYKKMPMEEWAIMLYSEQPLKHPERLYHCAKCFNKILGKLLKKYPVSKEHTNKIKKAMQKEEQREEEELFQYFSGKEPSGVR